MIGKVGLTVDMGENSNIGFPKATEGQEEEAALRRQLASDPTSPDCLFRLGVVCLRSGRNDEAVAFFESAVESAPDRFVAHASLAFALKAVGRLDEAIAGYRKAIALKPDLASLYNNLGNAVLQTGNAEEAARVFRQAVVLDPTLAEAHHGLAEALRAGKQPEAAIDHYNKAIGLKPGYAPAHNGVGAACFALDDWETAVTAYTAAVQLAPDYAAPFSNLGSALFNLAMDDRSIRCSRRAIALAPDLVDAHFSLAVALLCSGDYEAGLAEYEWRRRRPEYFEPDYAVPEWAGEDIAGKTILLYGEQGLGDAIQFARYATVLAERHGARVLLGVAKPLSRLLATVPGLAAVFARDDVLPAFDVRLPLLSVPYRVGTTLATIPAPRRYVTAPPAEVEMWQQRLADQKGLKVGVSWLGLSANPIDSRRSMAFEQMAPLTGVEGVSFVSLQNDRVDDGTRARLSGLGIVDFQDELGDFAHTAALVENLDLVVTVDTALAHLAGALGKPVWIPTCTSNDWRWMRDREDSPWYPSARLFRQTAKGDWAGVVARMKDALTQFSR